MITNDAICKREIKSRIVMAKNSIQHEEKYFNQQTGLKFEDKTSERLSLELSFVCC
jgi:hypothetical protein